MNQSGLPLSTGFGHFPCVSCAPSLALCNAEMKHTIGSESAKKVQPGNAGLCPVWLCRNAVQKHGHACSLLTNRALWTISLLGESPISNSQTVISHCQLHGLSMVAVVSPRCDAEAAQQNACAGFSIVALFSIS